MTKGLYSVPMSLDGFIPGQGGVDMHWLSEHLAEPNPEDPGPDGRHRSAPRGGEHEQRRRPQRVEGEAAEKATRYATDLRAAVALSKQLAGDSRYVSVLGADVARQLIEAGEVDEVLTFVAPVLQGDGVRMFENTRGSEVSSRPLDTSGSRTLSFEILRD
jgi:hypothetical protein